MGWDPDTLAQIYDAQTSQAPSMPQLDPATLGAIYDQQVKNDYPNRSSFDKMSDIGQEVADSALLGQANRLEGGLAAGLDWTRNKYRGLTGDSSYDPNFSIGNSYDNARKQIITDQQNFETANPGDSTALSIAGAIAAPLKLPGLNLTSKAGKILNASLQGAEYGGIYNTGRSQDTLSDIADKFKSGAGTGAVLGAGLGTVGQLIGGVVKAGKGIYSLVNPSSVAPTEAARALESVSGQDAGSLLSQLQGVPVGQVAADANRTLGELTNNQGIARFEKALAASQGDLGSRFAANVGERQNNIVSALDDLGGSARLTKETAGQEMQKALERAQTELADETKQAYNNLPQPAPALVRNQNGGHLLNEIDAIKADKNQYFDTPISGAGRTAIKTLEGLLAEPVKIGEKTHYVLNDTVPVGTLLDARQDLGAALGDEVNPRAKQILGEIQAKVDEYLNKATNGAANDAKALAQQGFDTFGSKPLKTALNATPEYSANLVNSLDGISAYQQATKGIEGADAYPKQLIASDLSKLATEGKFAQLGDYLTANREKIKANFTGQELDEMLGNLTNAKSKAQYTRTQNKDFNGSPTSFLVNAAPWVADMTKNAKPNAIANIAKMGVGGAAGYALGHVLPFGGPALGALAGAGIEKGIQGLAANRGSIFSQELTNQLLNSESAKAALQQLINSREPGLLGGIVKQGNWPALLGRTIASANSAQPIEQSQGSLSTSSKKPESPPLTPTPSTVPAVVAKASQSVPDSSDDPFQRLSTIVQKFESNNKPNVVSPKGAQGLMQLMPATAKDIANQLGEVYDPKDKEQNVRFGKYYLKQMLHKYQDLPLALAAYNWGPGKVDRTGAKSIHDIKNLPLETRNYVENILKAYTGGNYAV